MNAGRVNRPLVAQGALSAVLLFAFAGTWLSPRPPDLQEDVAGARYLPPLTRARAVQVDPDHVWIVTAATRTSEGWKARHGDRWVTLTDEQMRDLSWPRLYVLGTDGLGRDLASRLLFGIRHSVIVATLAVALALVLGTAVGAVAGLAGGSWDSLVMRSVDVVLAVPRLVVFLLCATFFRPSTALLVAILGVTTWPGLARLVRTEMLSLKGSDLRQSARATGCSALRTTVVHLLPQMAPVLGVTAALRFADTILLESALSFLGVGAAPPAVSLGGIIASARDNLAAAWWAALLPGAVLAGLVIAVRSTVSALVRSSEPPSVV